MHIASMFSYYITQTDVFIPELPIKKEFGKYKIYIDAQTPYASFRSKKHECAIYGLAVNVITGQCRNVAEEIVKTCADIQDLIRYEKQLGGKYILLFRNGDQYYLQGDATCSIPIFYNTDEDFICSNNFQYIFSKKQYFLDPEHEKIRQSGDISQAMPYDITTCKKIKQLIPNHYLAINESKSIRFINAQISQKLLSVEEATEAVLPMVEKMVAYYRSIYKLYCPITSGRDSRVVLAFLMQQSEDLLCYTIKHPEHRDDAQDLVVPMKLCRENGTMHELIEDVLISSDLKNKIDDLLGAGNYSLRTLRIAQTIKEHYGDGAIVNGDIIGQVGKCSLHRDIPSVFATPSYFRCKLHNYSSGAKKQLKQWLKEIKASGEKVNTFDLFSIENRMGRWAGQENLIYNSIGQVYLNIFNSRSIIYNWTAVSRKIRKNAELHQSLIRMKQPNLLKVLYGGRKNIMMNISKKTGLLYLISSYTKYYMDYIKFKWEQAR